MSPVLLLFITVNVVATTFGSPVQDGQDVGTVTKAGKKVVVTGQRMFPYVVYVSARRGDQIRTCAGVIVGSNAVLTAADCLHEESGQEIIVHAGIVDIKWEKDASQKRIVKSTLVHKGYKEECLVGKKRCCYGVNNIAILWTHKDFKFGPTVQEAQLTRKLEKPYGKQGWIVGWGVNRKGEETTMLQKGRVKVAQQAACEKFNPQVYVTGTSICLAPVDKGTRSTYGDAGGPFVSGGVVYGISSITISDNFNACSSKTLDLFTFVGKYYKWINDNVIAGPPSGRIRPRSQG